MTGSGPHDLGREARIAEPAGEPLVRVRRPDGEHAHHPLVVAQPVLARIAEQAPGRAEVGPGFLVARLDARRLGAVDTRRSLLRVVGAVSLLRALMRFASATSAAEAP